MEGYERGSHTVWDCKYNVVWVTKYRHPVLGGDVGQRCRELLRETARAHEMTIHGGGGHPDHFFDLPEPVGVSRSTTPEGEEFAQAAERIRHSAQTLFNTCGRGATG